MIPASPVGLSALESLSATSLLLLFPELLLSLAAMALLLFGAFRPEAMRLFHRLALVALLLAALTVLLPAWLGFGGVVLFGGAFVADDFSRYMKCLILLASVCAIFMSREYLARERLQRFEYPVLILLAALGMCLMVSANDLILLYLSLELQGLCLYVLAAFQRDSLRSSEAGLKYFVLGALSSGILLYGCSLLYGFGGSVNFAVLSQAAAAQPQHLGLVFGLVFVLAGLAFKVSAVPFHMWTPDVYEGAPTPVAAFFAGAAKLAAVALLLRFVIGGFFPMLAEWRQIVIALSVASMALGAFAAIGQHNIKRLMAYSAIGHVGYMLTALVAGSAAGLRAILFYLALYLVMNIGVFCAILAMRRQEQAVERIDDLSGLHERQPAMAFLLAILLFSLAGVPPLAGFFGKFQVFLAVVEAGLVPLAVIGVLASVVAAFYYLRIVKMMYFDPPAEVLQQPMARELFVLLALAGLVNLLFFIHPGALLAAAQWGAAALMPPVI